MVYVTKTATPKTMAIKNINLYFTYESRGTVKSFTLFITVKAITKLKLEHSDKFEIGRGSSSPHKFRIWLFRVVVLKRTAK